MGKKLKLIKNNKDKVIINFTKNPVDKITKKQSEVTDKFLKSACEIGSYGIAILDDVRTGSTIAVTNKNDVEIIAEMLASFTTTFAKQNNIPFEDFLDIYSGYFEKFMKRFEDEENEDNC